MRREYKRIELNIDEVKQAIHECKNYREMEMRFGCGRDFIRNYLLTNDLYEEYCVAHNMPITLQKHKCCICDKTDNVSKFQGLFYCKKHYNQMYRYGKIQKTIYDSNDIMVQGNVAQIVLRDKYQNIKAVCIIDAEDVEKIVTYKWYESAGYCVTKGTDSQSGVDIGNVIFGNYTHRYDHANHDRMDNRKANLRPVTPHENAMNMGKKITNTSGVTGVQAQRFKRKATGRWTANIMYNYQSIWLGVYQTFDEAVIARLQGEAKYFKEYAPNYNTELKLIDLTYTSQTDKFQHHIQMKLDGTIILNEKEIINHAQNNKES